MKKGALQDSLLVLFFSILLIGPLFRLKYMENWRSIESTFISDARMLNEHLPHPGWQPLWYCGTRFDYVYPPALRYGTALLAKIGHLTTARSYHMYTGLCYVFGILAIYWLVRIGSGNRWTGLLAAAGTALLSPSFLLLADIRNDSAYWVPQRLHVLALYGEGPHISSLSMLGAALAASLLTLREWRPRALAAAGVLCSLVVANNFYGATSLAIFFTIMVWSVWAGERDYRVWLRAGAIALLAYGLSAFWLSPSFVRITLTDMRWVSQPGNLGSFIATVVVALLFGAISLSLGKMSAERQWTVFVAGLATFLTLDVVGFFYFGFRMAGEAARLIPELDLALILAFIEIARALWKKPKWHVPVAILVVVAFAPSLKYLRHAWSPFPKSGSVESQYEYKITKWVHDNLPGARVLPAGTVRFWYDAWFDNAQPDGGSMQGMINQNIPASTWQIEHGIDPAPAIQWLQAMGTDAVIVSGKNSFEGYHDFERPERFKNLPVLFDDGHDTVIYGVPRVHNTIGRLVNAAGIYSIKSLRTGADFPALTTYSHLVEQAGQPVTQVDWNGTDEFKVRAQVGQGQSVLVQETFDRAWHAYEADRELTIHKDPAMEFMLIELPAGAHEIRMKFETPLENRAGQLVMLLSLIVICVLLVGKPQCQATP